MKLLINPLGSIFGVHEGGSNEHKCTKTRSPNGAKLAKMLHTTFTDQAQRQKVRANSKGKRQALLGGYAKGVEEG